MLTEEERKRLTRYYPFRDRGKRTTFPVRELPARFEEERAFHLEGHNGYLLTPVDIELLSARLPEYQNGGWMGSLHSLLLRRSGLTSDSIDRLSMRAALDVLRDMDPEPADSTPRAGSRTTARKRTARKGRPRPARESVRADAKIQAGWEKYKAKHGPTAKIEDYAESIGEDEGAVRDARGRWRSRQAAATRLPAASHYCASDFSRRGKP